MSEIIVPRAPALLRYRAKKRTVTLPDGTRALVTIDDSGTVQHTETSDRLDALVRPRSVTIQIRRKDN